MFKIRAAALVFAITGAGSFLGVPAVGALASTAVTTPTLVAIRAAHHPGFDRLVFEFRGGLPAQRSARYVSQVIDDPSGKVVPLVGSARLLVRFFAADGHNSQGHITYGPTRRTFALPGLIQVANAGDFEAVLSFGAGVARKEPFHLFTLTNPSRVVIDISTPFRTVTVHDFFLDSDNFELSSAVDRPVIPPMTAFGALQRLYAGPTQPELAAGLRLVTSRTTGFSKVTIIDNVARVFLTGGCNSGGSTFTIANEIFPTLKQFASVRFVKIFSPFGHTEQPTGHTDSIPICLEP